jgi:hypothetical protein
LSSQKNQPVPPSFHRKPELWIHKTETHPLIPKRIKYFIIYLSQVDRLQGTTGNFFIFVDSDGNIMDTTKIPEDLKQRLVSLYGEKEAENLMGTRRLHSLYYLAFKKKFRKDFGLPLPVVLFSLLFIALLFILLRILNG